MSYRVIRKYFNEFKFRQPFAPKKRALPGMTRVTLEQAQAHCRNPETSSKTCTNKAGKRRTAKYGPWFDCYEEN